MAMNTSVVDVKKTLPMNQYNPGIWVNLNDMNIKKQSLHTPTIQNTKAICIHKFTLMHTNGKSLIKINIHKS